MTDVRNGCFLLLNNFSLDSSFLLGNALWKDFQFVYMAKEQKLSVLRLPKDLYPLKAIQERKHGISFTFHTHNLSFCL